MMTSAALSHYLQDAYILLLYVAAKAVPSNTTKSG